MGYRNSSYYISNTGNIGEAIINLYGSKYITLIIDDYNQNHINNGLITITELDTKLKLPEYYTGDLKIQCNDYLNTSFFENNEQLDISSEKFINSSNVPQVVATLPRTITQNQIYTVNEILKNNSKTMQYKTTQSNPSDTMAIISVDTNKLTFGGYIIEDGSTLQVNKRVYFGPVNIDRFRVKLLDNNGNTINLNGMDWSMVLIAETLYQY